MAKETGEEEDRFLIPIVLGTQAHGLGSECRGIPGDVTAECDRVPRPPSPLPECRCSNESAWQTTVFSEIGERHNCSGQIEHRFSFVCDDRRVFESQIITIVDKEKPRLIDARAYSPQW